MVCGLQIEMIFAVRRRFLLIAFCDRAVCANGSDAILSGAFGGVQFAGQNDLAVSCLENESELTVTAFA
jgi:hypothetical protein